MTSASDPLRPSIVVLVAEDDMLIRMMAVDALTDAGFAVMEVEHADDALNILIPALSERDSRSLRGSDCF